MAVGVEEKGGGGATALPGVLHSPTCAKGVWVERGREREEGGGCVSVWTWVW